MLCVKQKKNRKRKYSGLELCYVSALYSDYSTIALHPGESLVAAFVYLSVDRLFDNLESRKCLKFCIPKSVRTLVVEGKTGSKLSIICSARNEPRGAAPFLSPPLALASPLACYSRVTSCVTSQTTLA